MADPSAVAEELYLKCSCIATPHHGRGAAEVASCLAPGKTKLAGAPNAAQQRLAALRELAWALLASIEFRFNH